VFRLIEPIGARRVDNVSRFSGLIGTRRAGRPVYQLIKPVSARTFEINLVVNGNLEQSLANRRLALKLREGLGGDASGGMM
jgi:hypothetical protein